MGRRGPPKQSAEVVNLRGTKRPDRHDGAELGRDPEGYEPTAPRWLNAAAKRIWRAKVAEYQRRGQRIQGFEEMLAQYVALEEQVIADRKRKLAIPASTLQTLLRFAGLFYDTPASAVEGSAAKGGGPANPFNDIGKR